ncbi:metallophosphoesterase [Lactococcus lactis]|uniref:Metallophosphoesterase n=1 Tax=Lactococcus lactis TaxID=1358 RepID=A0AAP3Z2S8_9LACT|nr:metallophosphoesterase [Lactococcus lactis]MDG4977306.1 metallophosphoesterase [Lactococcus lactis]
MANILTVGDIHMKADLVLPIIDSALRHHEVDKIIFMGDYFDEWGQNNYEETIDLLSKWIKEKRKNYEVVCLIGNHDAPYLAESPRHYSSKDPQISNIISSALFHDFQAQFSYEADGWLFCHGGEVDEIKLDSCYLQPLPDTQESRRLAFQEDRMIGRARGGTSYVGSLIWCDYDAELLVYGNSIYPKQVVAHSPQKTISAIVPHPERSEEQFICVDTFSLTPKHQTVGDGSLLLLKDGVPGVIKTMYVELVKQKYKK